MHILEMIRNDSLMKEFIFQKTGNIAEDYKKENIDFKIDINNNCTYFELEYNFIVKSLFKDINIPPTKLKSMLVIFVIELYVFVKVNRNNKISKILK